jgi:RNA polymerase sigma-70 factor (ECF subfamily)
MTLELRSPDPEEILANQGFMQRLARGIVGDEHSADDIVQQAWLAALERPPREQGSMRGWLARVVRNIAINQARSKSRRTDREQQAARPEGQAPSDHMELQLELQRRVLEAVQRLDKPYKTAIFLRYYEDLAPAEIAGRLAIPEATVKTRLRRGLATLRTVLDKEFGGDRRAWSLSLVSIATKGATSGTIGSSILSGASKGSKGAWMSAPSKIVAAGVLVAGALLWLWQPWRTSDMASPTARILSDIGDPISHREPPEKPKHEFVAGETTTTETRSAVASTPGTPAKEVKLTFRGRVLDSRRFPVAGAAVSVLFPGAARGRAETNERGEFVIELAKGPDTRGWRGGVRGIDDHGRAVVRPCDVSSPKERARWSRGGLYSEPNPNDRDLGTLVLEPSHTVRARVLDKGALVANAEVIAYWDSRRIPVEEARSDSKGLVSFGGIPTGKVMLRARTAGKEGSASTFASDVDAASVDIDLRETRTVNVRVVDAATGEGVPNAELWVTEDVVVDTSIGVDSFTMGMNAHNAKVLDLPIPQLDAEGRGRIDDVPAAGPLTVNCNAEGYLSDFIRGGFREPIRPGVNTVQLKLTKDIPHTVHWPIETGNSGIPPDGSTVYLRRASISSAADNLSLPELGRIERGELVVEALSRGFNEAVAEAPDGSLARIWIPKENDRGPAIRFQTAHKIDVLVHDGSGVPIAGACAQAFDQGNGLLIAPEPTGADGHAWLRGVCAQHVSVRVVSPGRWGMGDYAGDVDLEKGDGQVEFTLPCTIELCLRLRDGGRPLLPAQFVVRDADWNCLVQREDPEKGLVFLSIPVAAGSSEITLNLRASGYATTTKRIVLEKGAPPGIVDFDLVPASAIVVQLERPPDQKVEIFVDEWDAERSNWKLGAGMFIYPLKSPNGAGGTFRFADCPPGRYRVREKLMDVLSPDVEVAPGSREVQVSFDLGRVRTVSGVVEFPAGIDHWAVRVLTGDVGEEPVNSFRGDRYPGTPVDVNGAFTLKIPGNRPVRIRPWHPFLVPVAEAGGVDISDSRDDVRLRLAAGAEIRIPLPASFVDSKPESLRVLQFAHEPSGKPIAWFNAPIIDGVARFSGVAPGKWTLWIDPEKTNAPLVLRDVEVDEGITRLEQPGFSMGSSIHVHMLVKEGQSVPRVYAVAASRHGPKYSRSINSDGEDVVTLSGLARGTFDFQVMLKLGAESRLVRTVELDGTTDLDVDLDLR